MSTSKKARGHKRLWLKIEEWIESNKNLNEEQLFRSGREYVKVPFSESYSTKSRTGEYKGKTRRIILNGLLDIYHQWKVTLDELGEPYYLRIWLYDQRFSKSQVVCAIGPYLDFYESTFHKPQDQKLFDPSSYGSLSNKISTLNWEYALDEEHYNNTSVGVIEEYDSEQDFYESKRWLKERLKKPHRKTINSDSDNDISEYYSFKHGSVWIGHKDS